MEQDVEVDEDALQSNEESCQLVLPSGEFSFCTTQGRIEGFGKGVTVKY